ISASEWIAVIISIGFVMAAEAFNTAIEFLTDMVSPGFNRKAGLVKDIAASGVLIAAITAVVTGIVVFWKYLF
ncbi:MAG: diacylglycerol kinase family protein, partial [Syntrophothermus sp.]